MGINDRGVPYQLIETAPELGKAASLLAREEIIAVDLEADSLYHYREKVCLVQIAAAAFNLAIDPLAVGDLSPLKPVMADPAVRKVFHGSDYDLRSLYRDFQSTVANILTPSWPAGFWV
jgi:ribonuclease D